MLEIKASDERQEAFNIFLDILVKLNRLGILDTINGLVDDENAVAKVLGFFTNDDILSLLMNANKLINTLAFLSSDER